MKELNLLVVILVLAISAFAQTNQTTVLNKIAVIDTENFYNKKTGIKKLVNAERQIGSTDCAAMSRYYSLTKEVEKLGKEITHLQFQKLAAEDKFVQLQKLKDESKEVSDEIDVCKNLLQTRTVEPIIEKIRKKLEEFAKQQGYTFVAEKSGSILVEGEVVDITSKFIQFCNDYFNKEK